MISHDPEDVMEGGIDSVLHIHHMIFSFSSLLSLKGPDTRSNTARGIAQSSSSVRRHTLQHCRRSKQVVMFAHVDLLAQYWVQPF